MSDVFDDLPLQKRAIAEALARTNPAAAAAYVEGQGRAENAEGGGPLDQRRRSQAAGRTRGAPQRSATHFELSAKSLKATVVLDPRQLADCRVADGTSYVTFNVQITDGPIVTGRLNPKTVRKALARLAELGPDGAAVILQGRLQDKRLEEAGLAVQPKAVIRPSEPK
jgi:hypothetical protein